MKQTVRLVSLILVFAILLAVPAYATEEHAMYGSSYFVYTNAFLTKASGTNFNVSYHVTGAGGMDKIGVSYLQLQVSSDNSSWSPVASYYNLISTNSSVHSGSFTYTGVSGKYYRAYVEFYAMNDTGSGYKYYTTSSIKVP